MNRLVSLLIIGVSLLSFHGVWASEGPSGKKTVVLLVSLDPNDNPKGLAALFHNYKKYPLKLAATFNSRFAKSGFDVQIIQNADRYDLYQALHSSNNVGVFWVSHETPIKGKSDSIVDISAPLLDHHLSDVKSLFEEMNPNIRWVSIIACDSDLVINWLKGKSPSVDHAGAGAELQGFDTPVDANRGLKKAISLANPVLTQVLSDNTVKSCPEIQGYPIRIHRELKADADKSGYFPAISITVQGPGSRAKITSAFPEANLKAGEEVSQDADAVIPEVLTPTTSLHELQIVADSGLSPIGLPVGFEMGTFSISDAWAGAHWQVFAIDGVPMGVTEQILHFDGLIPNGLRPQTIEPSACN